MWFHLALEVIAGHRHLRAAAPAALLAVRRGRRRDRVPAQRLDRVAHERAGQPGAVPADLPPRRRVRRQRRGRRRRGRVDPARRRRRGSRSSPASPRSPSSTRASSRAGSSCGSSSAGRTGSGSCCAARSASAVGFALAAPVLNAFVRLLKVANVGIHTYPLATFTIPRAGLAQFVSPYVFGGDPRHHGPTSSTRSWTRIGRLRRRDAARARGRRALGAPRAGAAAAARRPGRCCSSARTSTSRSCTRSWSNLPGLTHLAVYRYDMRVGAPVPVPARRVLPRRPPRPRRAEGARRGSCRGSRSSLVFFVDRLLLDADGTRLGPPARAALVLGQHRAVRASCVGALVLAVVLALVNRRALVRGRRRASVLVVEAFGYFEVPILAWPRAATVDTAPLRVPARTSACSGTSRRARSRPTTARTTASPSLGASDLPIPKNWGAYVHATLSPCILPWQLGNGGPDRRLPDHAACSRAMKYVTRLRGVRGQVPLRRAPHPARPRSCSPRSSSRHADADGGGDGPSASAARVLPHRHAHLARDRHPRRPAGGDRRRRSAAAARCVSATPTGSGVGGEGVLALRPARARARAAHHLVASSRDPVHGDGHDRRRAAPRRRRGSRHRRPSRQAALRRGDQDGRQGRVASFYYKPHSIPRLVFKSPTSHVYLLPHPSPIATAPGCVVAAHSMTSFTTKCVARLDAHLPRALLQGLVRAP